jgi:hypothetical protein
MKAKFKVWCHNKNEWETDTCFLGQNGIIFQTYTMERMIPLKPNTHTASFFIGVKDDNRKEIYSADILKIQNRDEQIQKMEIICTLEFIGCVWYLIVQKVNKWEHYNIEPYSKQDRFPLGNFIGLKQIQTVGNVFENANLLR